MKFKQLSAFGPNCLSKYNSELNKYFAISKDISVEWKQIINFVTLGMAINKT